MTQMTALKRLASILQWSRTTVVGLDDNLRRLSLRVIENSTGDVFDPHCLSHRATLELLRADHRSFEPVFTRLFWLKNYRGVV
jgi:hypothetical protein